MHNVGRIRTPAGGSRPDIPGRGHDINFIHPGTLSSSTDLNAESAPPGKGWGAFVWSVGSCSVGDPLAVAYDERMDMEEIIEFLESRLAEDEGLAMALLGADLDSPDALKAERILAECTAKRNTIDYILRLDSDVARPEFSRDTLEKFVIIMASVYSAHHEFNAEWV